MPLERLGQILIDLQVVKEPQWREAVSSGASLKGALDQLQRMPAWWSDQQPAISPYQRERIEFREKRAFRDLDRDLRINDYLILALLGKGGMAVVYQAWALDERRLVALKRLIGNNPAFRDRQRREALILQRLNHPRVARFLAYGPVDDGEGPVLVMEFLRGQTLRDYIAQKGPVSVDQAVEWTVQLLEALQHAHAMGVIHRDISSKNIMVVPSALGGPPDVALLDFGISKLHGAREGLTITGDQIGTPQFMSPEHFENVQGLTGAADVYSLGCNTFLMLAGQPPFTETELYPLVTRHCTVPPPPLTQFRRDIPRDVEDVVQTMLRKRPDERSSTLELIARLRNAAAPRDTVESAARPPSAGPPPSLAGLALETSAGTPPLTHPLSNLWGKIVPQSRLASLCRFIDPVPTGNDLALLSVQVGLAVFGLGLLTGIILFLTARPLG